jgi:HlyD family secretion protein
MTLGGQATPMTQILPRATTPSVDGHATPPQRRLRHPPRRALIPLLVIVVAATAWLLRPQAASGPLTASGTVEVEEIVLAAEAAGRVTDLTVDEGSQVSEGQVVGRLTDPVLSVQVKQSVADAAQQQVTQAQMLRLELRAPQAGVVQKKIAHRGEFVSPGAPILTVADPSSLKLILYVLEADLGRVAVGQSVSIRADAFSDRVFVGKVRTISTRAEFTPRNVQTQKDRQNLVFGVTVGVPNPDGALKAGLPVDATFEP